MVRLLAFAGSNLTPNLISNGILALLRHPEQMQLLRERHELLPSAVEELMRYDTPVQIICRRCTEDTEIAGRPVAAGSLVAVLLGSANHDPDKFERPDELDLTRPTSAISPSGAASTTVWVPRLPDWSSESRLKFSWSGSPTSRSPLLRRRSSA